MKLNIYGDLSYFWQWDLNRKLVVEDDGVCSQVHFCNGTGPALVCLVRDENGLRVADVPNILLQKAEPIKAYLYTDAEDGTRTRSLHRFDVLARSRPEEYVYTETETFNYAYLDERLKELEGEGLANAFADYLEKNPPQAGATEEEKKQIQQNKQDIAELREAINGGTTEEYTADLSIVGFTRTNGTFSTADCAYRTDYVSTEGVTKIRGNAGLYSDCRVIAFYDASRNFLADISVSGSAYLSGGLSYGEGTFELDISGTEYANAAYFVVSTYRWNTVSYNQTFADDYCKYTKLVEAEDAPTYRISKNSIAFFGDSITAGAGDGDYPSLIASITGAKVTNHGKSGATLATGTTSTYHIADLVNSYAGDDDIICVSGGINDMTKSVPLGKLTKGYADALDTTTVIGALESIFRSLLTNRPTAKLYYVITHKASSAELNANSLGLTFTDYHDAIVSVLEKYSIPFYDAFSDSGFITSAYGAWGEVVCNLYTVNGDGVHPNKDGYMKYYVYPIIAMMEHGMSGSRNGKDGAPGEPGTTPVKGKDYFTDADKQKIAEQAAELVEIPDGVELDTTLTASGKAADAKAVGDALNGKLSKSGGTMTGKIVFPTGDQNVGFANSEDMKIFGYGTVNGTVHMRMGDPVRPFQIRGNGERAKYNDFEIALMGDIPTDDHINDLINTALGVIENGTY